MDITSQIEHIVKGLDISEFLDLENGAVYFLIYNDVVVYVGQAKVVYDRISSHFSDGVKKFNKVIYISVPYDKLSEVELYYIRKFKPLYNKSGLELHERKRNELCGDEVLFADSGIQDELKNCIRKGNLGIYIIPHKRHHIVKKYTFDDDICTNIDAKYYDIRKYSVKYNPDRHDIDIESLTKVYEKVKKPSTSKVKTKVVENKPVKLSNSFNKSISDFNNANDLLDSTKIWFGKYKDKRYTYAEIVNIDREYALWMKSKWVEFELYKTNNKFSPLKYK